jgi:serine/threonine protein kinase
MLEDPIGQGGMGVVWRGHDRETGTPRAIKLLRPEFAADPASVARFVRERTALVKFRHPNVVTLHDMIVEGDCLALVMDLIGGGDLDAYRRTCGGTLSLGEALALTTQICDALAAAHAAGIVHRDLKPANVLLDAGQVRLADFGIARIAGESPATTAGGVIGTVAFMAPEVIRGEAPTAACDVYAVGITLYELLTGLRPFSGEVVAILHGHLETVPTRPDGVPGRLWTLMSACLSKDPGARPSAAVLARALRDPALLREPALSGQIPPPAGSTYGVPPWTPDGSPSGPVAYAQQSGSTYAPPPQPGSTHVPWPSGPATASAVFPAADLISQADEADPFSMDAAGPPRTDRPAGHRRSRRRGHRLAWTAIAAAALVFAGAGGTYLAMSGSTADNAAGSSPRLYAATLSPTATHATSHPSKKNKKKSSARASAPAATTTAPLASPTAGAPAASAAPVGTPGPVGPDLVTDGDFTEPNLDAWEPVSSSVLVTGVQGESNAVDMDGPPAGVNQTVSVKPGTSYELSGWILSDTGANTTMIGVRNFNATDGISQRVDNTTWTKVTMTFTPVAGYTSADIFCWQPVAGTGYCTGLSMYALG